MPTVTDMSIRRPGVAAALGLLLFLAPATAGAGELPSRTPSPTPTPLDKTLSASEVMRTFDADYLPQVRDCYLRHAAWQRTAKGRLSLELVIRPVGTISLVTVTAPGVRGSKLEQCIRTSSEEWTFPDRSGFTMVQIPITLVKTRAPGAGPMKR